MRTHRSLIVLTALGICLLGLAVWIAPVLDVKEGFIRFVTGFLMMHLVYVAAVYWVLERINGGSHAGHAQHSGRTGRLLAIILVVSAALRVLFLLTPATLSDDIYRYVWDGRVQKHGIDPYRYPPEASELAPLRDPIFERINYKEIPTIYPPLMQMAFAAVTIVSESLRSMKAFFVLVDLAVVATLLAALGMAGLHATRVLIYAWNPLVAVEVAGSGHNDVLAIFFLVLAHAALLRRKEALFVLSLTLCGLAKLVGLVLAPLAVRWVRWRAWLAMPAAVFVVSWPYGEAGADAFRGLTAYGLRWRANDSLFHVVYAITDRLLGREVTFLDTQASLLAAKVVVGLLLAGWGAVVLWKKVPPLRGFYLAIGAILLLSPTVHPWYLVWIVPYLCFYPHPAWLLLTGSVVLAYHAPFLNDPGQVWQEHLGYKLLEYVPFFVLLAPSGLAWLRQRGSGRRKAAVL